MLFNSYEFIFVFMPVTVIVYFILNRFRLIFASKLWLALSSLFFYCWWDIHYLPLLLGSIAFNYIMGRTIGHVSQDQVKKRKLLLTLAIVGDVALLGYYKYADFFISNANTLLNQNFQLLSIVLPLGISFFTFTQIAYLVDAYRGTAKEYNIVSYVLFVTFYPHLIAGPILHHKEMMPQFDRLRNKRANSRNIAKGLFIFCIGLFKKVVIADTFSPIAAKGFDTMTQLNFIEGWTTSLAYTIQLYFDFSGYCDMAIGIALLFNIKLPINFNSPYKAVSIQDFWRRWHMTLSRFLRDYIYIPLGGSRKGPTRTHINSMATMLIGGFWHGAGWTFIFWGFLHGFAQFIHRIWQKTGIKMPKWFAWLITFLFVNLAWVFFRAKTWDDAIKVLKGMIGLNGLGLSGLSGYLHNLMLIAVFFLVAVLFRNSNEMLERFKPGWKSAAFAAFIFVYAVVYFNKVSEFLYFSF
ncbi:membrane-bound O-acyltransferase family protein [Paenibacillus sp. CAA11]|uniref:MBOAT family O-acyltransferase n=1 Tax=Paenibacillus sp. CAA11 TaxID=1532905 RepID=UPI000D354968|nr:MBOAT family protein [Paenibacillus sp. CAA11]AWB46348.1 membrane-bound O-acyltransferase family protein [Paenibacillus sp. CAA11]